MGALIRLVRKSYTNQPREIEARIDTGMLAIQEYLRGFFEPTELEIWQNAPMEELDGKLAHRVPLNVGDPRDLRRVIFSTVNNDFSTLYQSIIRINGIWKIDDAKRKGFFSINNAFTWRSAYGDVDFDIYPDGKAGLPTDQENNDPLVLLLWQDKATRTQLVNRFFDNFLNNYIYTYNLKAAMQLSWICFGTGVPSRNDVRTIKAAYYGSQRSFIKDSFATYHELYPDAQKALDVDYIVRKAYEETAFKDDIVKLLKNFRISRVDKHSVLLIGEELDSFKNLYDKLEGEYLKPVHDKLPKDQIIDNAIKEVFTKQKRLF